jgi:hypothetical protein
MAKTKKTAKSKKIKKTGKKKAILARRGVSAPEYFLFGFIITGAFLFAFLSWQSAGNIQTSFLTTDTLKDKIAFEKKIKKVTKGYPIEEMAPYISRKKKRTASFLVAIAKKESNWGRHAPKKNGRECFNYWGYRGSENPTASGYSCFDSPQHAVNVVGRRINKLVSQKVDTPKEMILWKCGSLSCARKNRGAAKWIWDVEKYYQKIYPIAKNKNKKVAFKVHK